MKPRAGARTTYTEEEWDDVAVRLRKVRRQSKTRTTTKSLEDRATLESSLREFLELAKEYPPRRIAAWKKLAKHLAVVEAELDKLAAQGMPLQWLESWREGNRVVLEYASGWGKAPAPHPHTRLQGSNRARGLAVDNLILRLLDYWRACGGTCNTSPVSAATLFVVAAAEPVIDLNGYTVVEFVRTLWSEYRFRV